MPQTMSVTEARDNFPALVRRVAERDEPVVVTSHNQPKAVLLRWETYQAQQQAHSEAARYRLARCVTEMERLAGGLLEAFSPHSLELTQGTQDLLGLAREAWSISRLLETPRRLLASLLTDVLLILLDRHEQLTERQLTRLLAAIPVLGQAELTTEMVAKVDQALLEVGLTSIFPLGDAEVDDYLTLLETPV